MTRPPNPAETPGAVPAPLPEFVEPELATPADSVPKDEGWIHEIKFDGYRILCRVDLENVRWMSRRGRDWSSRLGDLTHAVAALRVERAVLDGELVALNAEGASDFQALQNALSTRQDLYYYVFDLLYLDGYDLRASPLIERKKLLARLVSSAGGGPIRYVDHVEGMGEAFFRQACDFALEGVISKRADAPYREGRTLDWLKVKCFQRQEFVIVGFTDPAGGRTGFGSLLLALNEPGKGLRYAGRVGTGFSEATLRDLGGRLRSIERPTAPLSPAPPDARWVEPKLVADVSFSGWTRDGVLRHASFEGLREDKTPQEAKLEVPVRTAALPQVRARTSRVTLTHPERILYPQQGIPKRDLADYYERIQDWILPHLVDRPLSLVRCPEGQSEDCFFQKHATPSLPPAIRTFELPDGKFGPYVSDVSGLISLVQIGTLEIHPWGSTLGRLDFPDRLIFDLDPAPGVPWTRVIEAAWEVRERLAQARLESFVKLTGGKGLHVVVPLEPSRPWDYVKSFARSIAEGMAAAQPERYTARMAKTARPGKIFIDYHRNSRGATAVAAYSTRARPGAPVALPISWHQLTLALRPDEFTIKTVQPAADPWSDFFKIRQDLR